MMPRDLTKDEQHALNNMQTICQLWFECPPHRRPSPDALGQSITKLAAALSQERGNNEMVVVDTLDTQGV
jgi:hypothetical protein